MTICVKENMLFCGREVRSEQGLNILHIALSFCLNCLGLANSIVWRRVGCLARCYVCNVYLLIRQLPCLAAVTKHHHLFGSSVSEIFSMRPPPQMLTQDPTRLQNMPHYTLNDSPMPCW